MAGYELPSRQDLEVETLDDDPVTGPEFSIPYDTTTRLPDRDELIRKKWIVVGGWIKTPGLEAKAEKGKDKTAWSLDVAIGGRAVIARFETTDQGRIKTDPRHPRRPIVSLIAIPWTLKGTRSRQQQGTLVPWVRVTQWSNVHFNERFTFGTRSDNVNTLIPTAGDLQRLWGNEDEASALIAASTT